MKGDFHEEIERRRSERRRQRSNTWLNLIIRIIALIFILLIIRYFGIIRSSRLKSFFQQETIDSTSIQFPEKQFKME